MLKQYPRKTWHGVERTFSPRFQVEDIDEPPSAPSKPDEGIDIIMSSLSGIADNQEEDAQEQEKLMAEFMSFVNHHDTQVKKESVHAPFAEMQASSVNPDAPLEFYPLSIAPEIKS